jgi:hypothetical protein
MNLPQFRLLRSISLVFMLPGLAGLIASAVASLQYEKELPKMPVPAEMRLVPRSINGTIVYQTKAEDRKLSFAEGTSAAVFGIGLVLGCVYFRRWGMAYAIGVEDESLTAAKNR